MTRADKTRRRRFERDRALQATTAPGALALETLDEGQRWVLFAAINLLAFLGAVPPLKRLLAYLLCHCGLGLKRKVIAAALKLSPRSLSALRKLSPDHLVRALQPPRHKKTPKLLPKHVGPLARFLVDHPQARVKDVLLFAQRQLGVTLERHTLQRFVRRYSLAQVRNQKLVDRPLFTDRPPSAAPLS